MGKPLPIALPLTSSTAFLSDFFPAHLPWQSPGVINATTFQVIPPEVTGFMLKLPKTPLSCPAPRNV